MFNEVDCRKCNSQLKEIRGCVKDRPPIEIAGETITRCPLVYIGDIERFYLQAYYEYEKGYLPNDGGWLEQPIRFSQVIRLIERLIVKNQEEKNGRPTIKHPNQAQGRL